MSIKKQFVKTTAIALVAVMLLMSAACVSSNAPSTATTTASTQQQSTVSGSSAPVHMSVFINMSWYWTDKFVGIIPEEITKKTGVILDVTRAVDDKQLGLMIASGDLPELVYTDTNTDRLSNSNLCYSYDELISKYASDWQPNKFQLLNAKSFSSDDKYYAILQNFNTEEEWSKSKGIPMTTSLGFRADILKELGNPPMTNLDEYEKILEMVKQKYPELIPLAFSPNVGWRLTPFKIWVGGTNASFIETSDAKVIHQLNDPKYLEFLKLMNKYVRKGYISPDNFSVTENDSKALVSNAKCFSGTYYTQGELYRFGEMSKKVDPNAEIRESAPLGTGTYAVNGIGWAATFITKKNKNPDKAINFVKYLFSEEGQKLGEWGREGQEWTMGDDGLPKFSDEWIKASSDDKVFYTKYNPAFFFGTSACTESEGRISTLPKDYLEPYAKIRAMVKVAPWMTAALPKGDAQEKVILDKITDLVTNSEVKVILSNSDEEFNNNFQGMLKNADQIGISKLEDYMTKSVATQKGLYK